MLIIDKQESSKAASPDIATLAKTKRNMLIKKAATLAMKSARLNFENNLLT